MDGDRWGVDGEGRDGEEGRGMDRGSMGGGWEGKGMERVKQSSTTYSVLTHRGLGPIFCSPLCARVDC